MRTSRKRRPNAASPRAVVEAHQNFFTTITCADCERLLKSLAQATAPLPSTAWRKNTRMNKTRFGEHRRALLKQRLVSKGQSGYSLTGLHEHPNTARYAAWLRDMMGVPPDRVHMARGVVYVGGDLRPTRRAKRAFVAAWRGGQWNDAKARRSRPRHRARDAPTFVVLEPAELGSADAEGEEPTEGFGERLNEADYARHRRKMKREREAAKRTFDR